MTDSPFIPGAKVAIRIDGGYGQPIGYREAVVDKCYKTGRFTLVGSVQQWRPNGPGRGYADYWHASETGDHGWRGGGYLRIWDAEGDADIKAAILNRQRYDKFTKLKGEIERLRYSSELVTDEVLDWMQMVVLAVKPIKDDKAA